MIWLNICIRCCFLTPEIKWRVPFVKSFQDESQAVFNYATSVHLWIINLQLPPGWQWLTESYQTHKQKAHLWVKATCMKTMTESKGWPTLRTKGQDFQASKSLGSPVANGNPWLRWGLLQGLLRRMPSAIFIGSLFLLTLTNILIFFFNYSLHSILVCFVSSGVQHSG